ncbi:tol-pal system YbgF family protein [Zavarzinella formosa]|uniref:hypothetical protein n=1 Tax=Zavarzinella formosa TaxID=360055 RepID=UPI0002D66EBA|nr:hypothetical protein [Zavarzinella formosa]
MIRTFASVVVLMVGCCVLAQGPEIPAPTITKGPAVLPIPIDEKNTLDKLKTARTELKTEREATAKTLEPEDTSADTERREMRKKLEELIKRLDTRPRTSLRDSQPAPRPGMSPTDPKSPPFPAETSVSAATDALLLAQNLYKSGDYPASLRAFKLIDLTLYAREDKAFIQYMTGCCLRRTGKLSEAAVIFRDVADTKDDEFVTECALWQLGTLRWREDMEKQLAQLKQRREAMAPK